MRIIGGPDLNPFSKPLFLLRGERAVAAGRGHSFLRVVGFDPLNQKTAFRSCGGDDLTVVSGEKGVFGEVETEARLSLLGVRTVAGITELGENRLNIAGEGKIASVSQSVSGVEENPRKQDGKNLQDALRMGP